MYAYFNITFACCKAFPFNNFANKDISVEKNIDAALIRTNIKIIKSHISFLLSIVKNNTVIINSTVKSEIIKGLILNLSIIAPENGIVLDNHLPTNKNSSMSAAEAFALLSQRPDIEQNILIVYKCHNLFFISCFNSLAILLSEP